MDIKTISTNIKAAGLQNRDAQLSMIETAWQALNKQQKICIEAPTGTGKTLSYLLAGYYAKKAKQTVIVSTATIALQEQLIGNELPLLTKIVNKKFTVALVKGRRHYLCLAKLYSDEIQHDLFNQQSKLGKLTTLIEQRRWRGDRDQLPFMISDSDWQKVSTDSAGCSSSRCQFFEDCPFFKIRKKSYHADFIVTNHNILLADLAMQGGVLLPEPEKSLYIIDECHHLPPKALAHFAKHLSIADSHEWISQINKIFTRLTNTKIINSQQHTQATNLTKQLVAAIKLLQSTLQANSHHFKDNVWHIDKPNEALLTLAKNLLQISHTLANNCQQTALLLEKSCDQHKSSDPAFTANLSKQLAILNFLSKQAEDFHKTWQLFCHQRQTNEAPIARWFESKKRFVQGKSVADFSCECAPINVGKALQEHFWGKMTNGVLLCSATLRSLNKFDDYLRKTGLNKIKDIITHVVPSFFTYQHSLVYVPKMQNEPLGANQNAHLQETIQLLPQLFLPQHGTLVLFTSRNSMEQAYSNMPNDQLVNIAMQGKTGKNKLIKTHKQKIDNGERSILFGLASFAEGLDLPAEYCQHVIIHKLPFAVPSHPIELTRNAWITTNRLNAFLLSTLPETSLRLTQYIGRLIRRESDRGIVTILDRRLYTKNYGSQLLANIPQFSRLINATLSQFKQHPIIQELQYFR